jgi:hypothetical protein
MLQIVMLIFGLILLVCGKAPVGKRRWIRGTSARVAGLILIAPVLVALVDGVLVHVLSEDQIRPLARGLDAMELCVVITCALIGLFVLRSYSVYVPPPIDEESRSG